MVGICGERHESFLPFLELTHRQFFGVLTLNELAKLLRIARSPDPGLAPGITLNNTLALVQHLSKLDIYVDRVLTVRVAKSAPLAPVTLNAQQLQTPVNSLGRGTAGPPTSHLACASGNGTLPEWVR